MNQRLLLSRPLRVRALLATGGLSALVALGACRSDDPDRALGLERDRAPFGQTEVVERGSPGEPAGRAIEHAPGRRPELAVPKEPEQAGGAGERAAGGEARSREALGPLLEALAAERTHEIELGKLALARAERREVKELARLLIGEERGAGREDGLEGLRGAPEARGEKARGAKANAPELLLRARTEAAEDRIRRLSALRGAKFDAAFLREAHAPLTTSLALAEEGRRATEDAELDRKLGALANRARERVRQLLAATPLACGGEPAPKNTNAPGSDEAEGARGAAGDPAGKRSAGEPGSNDPTAPPPSPAGGPSPTPGIPRGSSSSPPPEATTDAPPSPLPTSTPPEKIAP